MAAAEKDAESAEAVVTMSDGSTISGTLSIIGSNPLTISPNGESRQRQFYLRDMLSIEHGIESANMKRPWVYKEAGSIEKFYFDEKEYPFVNFLTKITLVDGSVVTGHIVSAAFNIRDSAGKHKLFLQRQIKGEKGQAMEEAVFPSSIRFPGSKAKDAMPLMGVVEGLGKLEKATAFDIERENVVAGKISEDGKFDFGNLLPGYYDVTILTDSHALTGFSQAVPSNVKDNPLQEEDLDNLKKVFPLTDDFFKERWLMCISGSRNYAKTLAYKRRADYVDDMGNPVKGVRIWHLELMTWHLPESEWQLDRRFILIRHKQQDSDKPRKLFAVPGLGAVKPGTDLKIGKEAVDGGKGFIRNLD